MDEETIAMMASHQWSRHCDLKDDVKEEGIVNNLLRTIALISKYDLEKEEDNDLFIDACCIDMEALASKL